MSKVLVNTENNVVVYVGEYAEPVENGIDVGDRVFGYPALIIVDTIVPEYVTPQDYSYVDSMFVLTNPIPEVNSELSE